MIFSPRRLVLTLPKAKKNMCQKREGMGLHGFISKEFANNYAENMKRIMGAVWELPAK